MPVILPGARVRLIKEEEGEKYILMVLEETSKAALLDPSQPSKIRWRLPGGKVEIDIQTGELKETPFETMNRELLEEKHLRADADPNYIMYVEYINSDGLERAVWVFNATNHKSCTENLNPDHRVLDSGWFLLKNVSGELFSGKYGKTFPVAKRHISYVHLI